MDLNAIIATLTGVAGVSGGYLGGRQFGSDRAVNAATTVAEMLQLQMGAVTRLNESKDREIDGLKARIEMLESLVTQRADVEAVHVDVKTMSGVVDRIATKVGA